MDPKTTRGFRNNNPGNLRAVAGKLMIGETGVDDGFRVFDTPVHGIRALARQILLYQQRGINTVAAIVATYAPPSENNSAAYVANVCARLGVSADEELDLTDFKTVRALVEAQIAVELGGVPYSGAQLDEGVKLAGLKPPAPPASKDLALQLTAIGATTGVIAQVAANVESIWTSLAGINPLLPHVVVGGLGAIGIAALGYFAFERIRARIEGRA